MTTTKFQEHNCIVKTFYDYPAVIFDLEVIHYTSYTDRKATEQAIAVYEAGLDLEIADNPELRNESMRKAYKITTLAEDEEYQSLQAELEKLQRREKVDWFTLERHKREFEVLKLEKQGQV